MEEEAARLRAELAAVTAERDRACGTLDALREEIKTQAANWWNRAEQNRATAAQRESDLRYSDADAEGFRQSARVWDACANAIRYMQGVTCQ
jgi:hypothetical protein